MPRQPVKRLNALSLLLGFAVFIPITGCSQFAGVSKNCDELAQKYLKTRFENAAANNEGLPSEIVVIERIKRVKVYIFDGPNTVPDLLYFIKIYKINQSGAISVTPVPPVLGPLGRPSSNGPAVVSSNQIVCQYPVINGPTEFGVDVKNQTYYRSMSPYESFGTSIQVSEDKDSIHWKENPSN